MKRTYQGMSALFGVAMSLSATAGTVATVNGKAITDEDLSAAVSTLPQYQKDIAMKDPNARKQLIQDLVDQELMVQDATAKKIEATKEYKEAFNNSRKQVLINTLVQKQLSPRITEASVKDFYNKNKSRYSTDEVHAQHILLSTNKEAEEILSEVKRPGVDFQKIAETRSKDPSAKNTRGDVGYFSRTMFDQAFTDAAFGANAGDIVGPIKTAFGWHVIKVVDRRAGKVLDFVEVEQRVRADLQRELLRNYVMELRKKAKVKE
jgi:peptidyl-prolyl cis-trans isomerase C